MTNCNNFYDKFAIKNVVDDSVDAHSDSVTIMVGFYGCLQSF